MDEQTMIIISMIDDELSHPVEVNRRDQLLRVREALLNGGING